MIMFWEKQDVKMGKCFWVSSKGTSLGEFSLNIIGDFNISNALASIIVGVEAGLSFENIKRRLGNIPVQKKI